MMMQAVDSQNTKDKCGDSVKLCVHRLKIKCTTDRRETEYEQGNSF